MTKTRPAPIVGDRMALEPIVVRADVSLAEAARLLDGVLSRRTSPAPARPSTWGRTGPGSPCAIS